MTRKIDKDWLCRGDEVQPALPVVNALAILRGMCGLGICRDGGMLKFG